VRGAKAEVLGLRPSHLVLKQKRLQSTKSRNEGINESGQKQFGRAGLILLFAEKLLQELIGCS